MNLSSNPAAYTARQHSWHWLAIGALLMVAGGMQPLVALVAWIAPIFLLRYARAQHSWRGFALLALAMSSIVAFQWAVGFAPVTMFGICGAIAALWTLIGYIIDCWLHPRLTGVAATLIFPLALTVLDWLGSTLAAPLSTSLLPSLLGVAGTFQSPAYTQAGDLVLMQIVSVTGLWGLTFLISWFPAVINAWWEHGFNWRPVRSSILSFSIVALTVLCYGSIQLARPNTTAPTVQVAGIVASQDLFETITNMNPQELMPGTSAQRNSAREHFAPIVDDLFARSQRESQHGAKIIVWGETSAPVLEEDVPALLERAQQAAQAERIYLQLGMVVFNKSDHYPFLQNRAILFDPTGKIVWDYHKARPTPGENTMVVAGPARVPIVDTPYGRIAAVICYDADFPGLMRQVGAAKVDIVLMPYQDWDSVKLLHAQMAAFRAVENGVSFVRPSNQGLSTIVDWRGRTLAQVDTFGPHAPAIVTAVATHGVATIYAQIGDSFAYGCLAVLLMLVGERCYAQYQASAMRASTPAPL